ncbi:glycosyltransferase [candidate division KSB1 bacterium]|nr:glycosyltransferase [candidate division KSB1 bacterium]
MKSINDYRGIVDDRIISNIYKLANRLYGKRVIHVNSTYYGGGVAEILSSLVPLMNDAGIDAGWRIIRGSNDLFSITKKFHNALQGDSINLSTIKKKLYMQANEDFSTYTHLDHDLVIIHDPQPLPLIQFYKKRQPWIWRCHIDLSHPHAELWDYLKGFILKYDSMIVSHESYKNDLPMRHYIINPAIDPLTHKNKPLNDVTIKKIINKFHIPTDKPLITQISRFDKWKDPIGVINVFKRVKKKIDCRLILCGNMASDDPEGLKIYEKVKQDAQHLIKSGDLILLTYESHILVNVLQQISRVIIQKSIREGFGLTVTEALWKQTPVVASRVGGIPLQIEHGINGFLYDPHDYDGFAEQIIELINNDELAHRIGTAGKEYVREKFLITRILIDYLELINQHLN